MEFFGKESFKRSLYDSLKLHGAEWIGLLTGRKGREKKNS